MKALFFWALIALSAAGKAQEAEITVYRNVLGINTIAIENDTLWVGARNGLFQFLKDGTFIKTLASVHGLANDIGFLPSPLMRTGTNGSTLIGECRNLTATAGCHI